MYCPNCGKETSSQQRFCRSCGLGLEKVAQSVNEQLPTELDENLLAQKARYERWGRAALSVFGLGVLSLILYFIVYQEMIVKGDILGGLAALGFILLVAAGLASVLLFVKASEVKQETAKRRSQAQADVKEAVKKADTTGRLLPEIHLEPLPSVTEQTTDLLLVERERGGVKEA